jgi:adenine-specific DNA methylase
MDRISNAELRRYDLNIVAHWQAITEKPQRRRGRGEI